MNIDSKALSTLENIYIYVLYIYVNSEIYVAIADLPSILYYRAITIYSHSYTKTILTGYTRLYTLLIIYLYIYYTPTLHTTES